MHTPTLQGKLLQMPWLYSLIVSTNRDGKYLHFCAIRVKFPIRTWLGMLPCVGEQVRASECVFTSALRHKQKKDNLKHPWKIGLLSPMWLRKCSPLWLTHKTKAGAALVLCVDSSILAPVLEGERIEWCLYLPPTSARVLKKVWAPALQVVGSTCRGVWAGQVKTSQNRRLKKISPKV